MYCYKSCITIEGNQYTESGGMRDNIKYYRVSLLSNYGVQYVCTVCVYVHVSIYVYTYICLCTCVCLYACTKYKHMYIILRYNVCVCTVLKADHQI